MVEITGISSHRIGLALGGLLIAQALIPKALAVILATPGPVITAFVMITMATIFIIGMKLILQDGIDHRNGLISGISFWIGAGFQGNTIIPAHVPRNGMLTGGPAAVVMTMIVELGESCRRWMEVALDPSALQELQVFIGEFVLQRG